MRAPAIRPRLGDRFSYTTSRNAEVLFTVVMISDRGFSLASPGMLIDGVPPIMGINHIPWTNLESFLAEFKEV